MRSSTSLRAGARLDANVCDRSKSPERDTPAKKAPVEKAPSPSVMTTKNSNDPTPPAASAEAETLCSERYTDADSHGNRAVVSREIYSFPKLNEQLAKYPELRAGSASIRFAPVPTPASSPSAITTIAPPTPTTT